MTLKKFLKYVDFCTQVRIWDAEKPCTGFDLPLFEGWRNEVPKKIKNNYRLVKAEENHGSEALFPFEDGKLRITVIKK